MKLLCLASLLTSAAAFTSSGAFTVQSHSVGARSVNVDGAAHRTRKATIVMDGKANGTYFFITAELIELNLEIIEEMIFIKRREDLLLF